jgi:hypothetical protein
MGFVSKNRQTTIHGRGHVDGLIAAKRDGTAQSLKLEFIQDCNACFQLLTPAIQAL